MSLYVAQLVAGLSVLLAYFAMVCFVASKYIRLTNVRWLEAHQAALLGRLKVETEDRASASASVAARAAIETLAASVQETDTRGISAWRRRLRVHSWIGSEEIAAWVRLHEAQRLEAWRLPDHVVQARFARAMGQLDELSAVRQNAWFRRWEDLQRATPADVEANQPITRRWRAELSQLLAELFNARDSTYNQLVSLYGKAAWLLLTAYLPVIALLSAGYGYVLLAGFLGGLIGRMQHVLYGKGRPTAYGTSWVPMFLAPLLGALAAWAGLHLLSLLQALGVVKLEAVLRADGDYRLSQPVSILGLALLLGLSERLFNRLGSQVDKVIAGSSEGGSPAVAGSPTRSFPPVDGPNGYQRSQAVSVAADGSGDDPKIRT
jgi:hypothetical protein